MGGLGIVALVVALGALAAAIGGLPTRARRARRRRRGAVPAWVREPPPAAAEAERRSLALLRSVVNPEEWRMFRELGFICADGARRDGDGPRHRYLIYPHLPLVALRPRSMTPVREYCIQFLDREAPTPRLPGGDDVLAKWMTIRADEDRLLAYANVASPGSQVPLGMIDRDLRRLARWRAGAGAQNGGEDSSGPGSAGGPGSSSAVSSSMRR